MRHHHDETGSYAVWWRRLQFLLLCWTIVGGRKNVMASAQDAWLLSPNPKNLNRTFAAHMPPPLKVGETQGHRDNIDFLLQQYWQDQDVYGEDGGDNRALTYGEVTPLGVRQLIHHVFFSGQEDSTKDIEFFDLGSGVGRMVIQWVLELSILFDDDHQISPDKRDRIQQTRKAKLKATGVELSKSRHQIAISVLRKLEADNILSGRNSTEEISAGTTLIDFVQGDILEADISHATHLYLSSLCFPDFVKREISERIVSLSQNSTHGNLPTVMALSDLIPVEESMLWRKQILDVRMTWGPGRVRIYIPTKS